jgi:hypothetical protein
MSIIMNLDPYTLPKAVLKKNYFLKKKQTLCITARRMLVPFGILFISMKKLLKPLTKWQKIII